jgi:FkbM family methyltransferase
MKPTDDFRSRHLENDLYHESAANYAEQIEKAGPIVIWGSLSAGQTLYDFLVKFGVPRNVKYFADNNKQKWGTRFNGLPVVSADEVVKLAKENPDTRIIIASIYLAEIRKQLLSLGIDRKAIDTQGFYLAKNYWIFRESTAYQLIQSRFGDYESVYASLSDERSKAVYLGILNSKISLDSRYLEGIASPSGEQYFDKDLIKLSENEVFCDCGSFNGDTLETFIALSGGKYKKYIAIEADKDTFAELNQKIAAKGYANVQTHNLACWNEKTVLKFQPAQTAGHVTEQGGIAVNADTLDNILNDENVTFLKMDIEGAEEMALKGAGRVIRQHKPILAICLYHSLEDHYKLPLIMKELNPDYRLFVRHYTDMVDVETVCYAIPEDRWTP